jgi:hypothetical protein
MNQQAKPVPDVLRGRDWLMTQDWSDEELEIALQTAEQLKCEFKAGVPTIHHLPDCSRRESERHGHDPVRLRTWNRHPS